MLEGLWQNSREANALKGQSNLAQGNALGIAGIPDVKP